jgi:hypothetical protein
MNRPAGLLVRSAVLTGACAAAVFAQRTDAFVQPRDHPAIEYSKGPVTDRVAELNRKILDGSIRLQFDGPSGYLRSALEALKVPVESQVALFSQNSSQGDLINMKNPRALFFNDAVSIGFVRGGTVLEAATQDPRQGVIFYTLDQKAADVPQFKRNDGCLACHLSWTTLGVPGLFVFSMLTLPDDKNAYASGFASDDRTSFASRWGGWYVTGSLGSIRHMGNKPVSTASTPDAAKPEAHELKSLAGQFDTTGYPSPYSDVAALMVLEHQTNMTNLITWLGWESRLAAYEARTGTLPIPTAPGARTPKNTRVEGAAADLVDYALFVYEEPLPGRVRGSSGFAEKFSALGPADRKGRSLRELDLGRHLMRYPCSYMIYSDAFGALPVAARNLVYRRMWQVLSGQDKSARYARLSLADRQAIVDILRDTKKDLPADFQPVTR